MNKAEANNAEGNGGVTGLEENVKNKTSSVFLKQLMICFGICTLYFVHGLSIGAPTVMIPQLRKDANSTRGYIMSDEMTYWLSSIFGVGGLPWVFILPYELEMFGPKKTFHIISVVIVFGFTVFTCSFTSLQILIGEMILGILVASCQSVTLVFMTEYTSSEYRGVFLSLKSASYLWGVWIANTIGTYYPWKYIGLLALVCCIYLITSKAWPESPFWLASKGRYVDCIIAHRWLKGTSLKAEQELANLIQSQKRLLENQIEYSNTSFIRKFAKMWSSREFYRPMLLSILIYLLFYLNGKLVCNMYIIKIVKNITANESTAYKTMLIVDGVAVLAAYVGCILSKFLKRRVILFISLTATTVIQFISFIYLTLIQYALVNENNILTVSILIVHSVAAVGANLMCSSIVGEVLPLRFKSWAVLFTSLISTILHFSFLRSAPELFTKVGLNITFLFYSLGSLVCLVLAFKYVPETKDKTLLEIEGYFKDKQNKEETNNLMS